MSDRETSPEIASMAGRILSAGNPLDNEQVLSLLVGHVLSSTKQVKKVLSPAFQPYFDNMMSLAGSCLSQAEEDEDSEHRIIITATVDWSKIVNAIIGAFEGGATYWLREADYVYTPDDVDSNPRYAEDAFWAKGGQMRLKYDDPESDERRAEKVIGLIEIKQGLRSMAEKDPRHFGDLVSENDDAITHDVFIQHVLFGEIIYG